MRIVRIVARVLFVLVMVGALITFLLYAALSGTGAKEAGWLYIPTNANMQAHADRLADHFAYRLAEPPMPLLVSELGADSSRERIGESWAYPYLATADLPPRYGVLWTSADGWLSDTPKQYRDLYDHWLNAVAEKSVEDKWENVSQFSVLGITPDHPDSTILAGQWIYTESGTSFRGAITNGFYEYYAPRWFLEYKMGQMHQFLDNYMWRPAEFRIAFHDSTDAPVVLRPGRPVDMVERLKETGDMPEDARGAEEMTVVMRWMNTKMNAEPGWQDDAEWREAYFGSIYAKIQVASPFKMDQLFYDLSGLAGRWAVGLMLAGILFGILGWGTTKR